MNLDDIVLRVAETREEGFEALAPQAISRAVLDTLENQESVTIDDIIVTMQGWLEGAKANEPVRIAVNAGIRHLENLLERRRST